MALFQKKQKFHRAPLKYHKRSEEFSFNIFELHYVRIPTPAK